MNHFFQALTSGAKNEALPEEFNFFGKLIGSWDIDYVDSSTSQAMRGEWHVKFNLYAQRMRWAFCFLIRIWTFGGIHYEC